ncbi:hypothetical protein EC12741_2636 [Escherichia coli 1.2741]|nr:hypothetical protein ECSTEC7V_3850 [Escherichia coli STEC_7v]EIG81199.1 hypothetical protein EC12741_2636 [Escherichia coli 1.2741]
MRPLRPFYLLHLQHNVTAQLLESASHNVKKTHVTSPPGLLPADARRIADPIIQRSAI